MLLLFLFFRKKTADGIRLSRVGSEMLIRDRSTSLVLSLVRALTRQLRGELIYDYDNGSRFAFSFAPRPLGSSMA